MNTKNRILKYLDIKGITKTIFFTQTGIKRGFLDADKLSGAVNDEHFAKILVTYPDLNLEWLITGEGEMLKSANGRPVAQSPPTTSIIYKSDPRDLELLDLQRKQIKLLEEKLSQWEGANLDDARFGALAAVADVSATLSERAPDDYLSKKKQS